MKVLLAEDSDAMRRIVRNMLGALGYPEVRECSNGAEAWQSLQDEPADLILTDWNMPIMSGLELVQKVRGRPETAQTPTVMLTSRASRQDVVVAVRAGVTNYLAKPFTLEELKDRIDRAMENRGTQVQGRVNKVLRRARRLGAKDSFTAVAVGLPTAQPDKLAQTHNRHLLDYVERIADAVDRAKVLQADDDIGFHLEDNGQRLVRLVRFQRRDLRLLLIPVTIPGGGITLARLARLNRSEDLTVCIVAESLKELPESLRAGLERLGILQFEFGGLDADVLDRLLEERVVAPSREPSDGGAALPPEAIQERLDTDIRLLTALPVLPQIYHRIMSLWRDRESTIDEWSAAIEAEPMSSALLLRHVRSPIYGFRTQIDDVGKAVALIGKERTKELIVSAALRSSLGKVGDEGFDTTAYWLHSAAVALTARILAFPMDEAVWTQSDRKEFASWQLPERAVAALADLDLARRLGLGRLGDPFAAGMMHDIGKVALACAYPGIYGRIVEVTRQRDWRVPLSDGEARMTGCATHVRVGGILGQAWELAEETLKAVTDHHEPGDHPLAQLICLADAIAGAVRPYPVDAEGPLRRAVDAERRGEDVTAEVLEGWEGFLPADLLDTVGIDVQALVSLATAMAGTIDRGTEKIRLSVSGDPE